MLKYFVSLLILASAALPFGMAFAGGGNSLEGALLVNNGVNSARMETEVSLKDNFLKTIQVYLVSAYGLIAVGMFIFIGFRLFNARGNEAEFKQAWVALAYTVVGLAIAPLAFLIVKIVTGFSVS